MYIEWLFSQKEVPLLGVLFQTRTGVSGVHGVNVMSAVASDRRIDLECVETQTRPGLRFVEEIQVKSVYATEEHVFKVRIVS